MAENQKIKNVTVPVEFVRQAIIMRQRQRKYSATLESAYIVPAKQAEKEFDALLEKISRELIALQAANMEVVQGGLL